MPASLLHPGSPGRGRSNAKTGIQANIKGASTIVQYRGCAKGSTSSYKPNDGPMNRNTTQPLKPIRMVAKVRRFSQYRAPRVLKSPHRNSFACSTFEPEAVLDASGREGPGDGGGVRGRAARRRAPEVPCHHDRPGRRMRSDTHGRVPRQRTCSRLLPVIASILSVRIGRSTYLPSAAHRELLFQFFGLSVAVLCSYAHPRPPSLPSLASRSTDPRRPRISSRNGTPGDGRSGARHRRRHGEHGPRPRRFGGWPLLPPGTKGKDSPEELPLKRKLVPSPPPSCPGRDVRRGSRRMGHPSSEHSRMDPSKGSPPWMWDNHVVGSKRIRASVWPSWTQPQPCARARHQVIAMRNRYTYPPSKDKEPLTRTLVEHQLEHREEIPVYPSNAACDDAGGK